MRGLRKISILLVFIIITTICSIPVFAAGDKSGSSSGQESTVKSGVSSAAKDDGAAKGDSSARDGSTKSESQPKNDTKNDTKNDVKNESKGDAKGESAAKDEKQKAAARWGAEITDDTENPLIKIYNPVGNLSTTHYFLISAEVKKDDVVIETYIWSKDDKDFIPLENVDGESKWKAGSIFSKDFELTAYGKNVIRVLCYRESDPDAKQYKEFTVVLRKKGLTDFLGNLLEGFIKSIKGGD